MSTEELSRRRRFVTDSHQDLDFIKHDLTAEGTGNHPASANANRSRLLEGSSLTPLQRDNQDFMDAQSTSINAEFDRQNEVLTRLGPSISNLKGQAIAISGEVQAQGPLIEQLGLQVDNVRGSLLFNMQRVQRFLGTTQRSCIGIIVALVVVLVILLIYVIATPGRR